MMGIGRKILSGGLLMGIVLGVSAITTGCGDSGGDKAPTQVKVDEKATQEHNDKMKEFMQGKSAAKKPAAK
jgi:hypothetical protein